VEQPGTQGEDYTARLEHLEGARWKKLPDVQRPYRWNLRRLSRTHRATDRSGRTFGKVFTYDETVVVGHEAT
jgi:hypothetical protein